MPIQQHPIPQEVAGYKFRLIGDMTVKQFVWLAAGIILGIIFWSLPLPFFFKYPLAIVSVALGAGSAFVPIQGRPMDKWLIAFIKSIYSPTQYVWQKGEEGAAPPIRAVPTPSPYQVDDPMYPHGREGRGEVSKPTPPPTPTAAPAPPVPTREVTIPQPEVIKVAAAPRSEAQIPRTPAGQPVPTQHLPIPFTPTTSNTLVGMTLTPDGKILPAALVEIKLRGNTIRATKSNQLGQFLFAKPLENGLYQIATEKEGFKFDTYSLELTGQIVKPLRLQAKLANST